MATRLHTRRRAGQTRARSGRQPRPYGLFAPIGSAVVLVGGCFLALIPSAGLAAAGSSAGATPALCTDVPANLTALGLSSASKTAPNGFSYTVWSGHVASFDGLPLQVYLTTPASSPCSVPLVSWNVGYGADASSSVATTDAGHWDNVWWAEQGDATLSVTQRGFQRSCGPQDSSNGAVSGLPAACTANGRHYWMQYDDALYNVRDLQWMIGDVVDTGLVNPAKIAVSGDSMGGELTWLMALLNDRTPCGAVDGQVQCGSRTGGFIPWTSPGGTPLRLEAAIPEYGWYLGGSMHLPNGRASDGLNGAPPVTTSPDANPIGVSLRWFATSLTNIAKTSAFLAPANTDPTANWAVWFQTLQSQINSQTAAPGTSLGTTVSALTSHLDADSSAGTPYVNFDADVPILALQGLDDSVMSPVQAQLLYDKAKAYDPNYPISVVWGDVGHVPASQSPAELADFALQANTLLTDVFAGTGTPSSTESSYVMDCNASTNPYGGLEQVSAPALTNLETSTLTFSSSVSQTTTNTASGSESQAIGPAQWTTCPALSVQTDAGVASWTWSSGTSPTALLGAPVVSLSVRSTGADAELDTRLWVESGKTQTLMSTTPYRFVSAPSSTDSTVTFELPMTAWLLGPGQTLKLEVTGDDEPSYEYDSVPATTTIDKATLTLPTTDLSAYGQPLKQTATHGVVKTMRIGAFEGAGATQAGQYGATVDWGDGTTSAGAVSYYGSNVYQVLATHSWAAAGTYPIVLKVTAPHSITVTYHTTAAVS